MEQIKTYMGEVVNSTSPTISEQEAIENASFGKYTYDPMSRMQQTMVSLPGWQGYSTSMNPNGFYQQPMGYIGQSMMGGNGNYGLGMNPYIANMYSNQYGANPYNPNPIYYQQQQPQCPQNLQIPPLNYRGEFLPPLDYEEKLNKLSNEYWIKEQEEAVKNQRNYNTFGYGYNYYGNYMYGGFYNPLRNEANNIVLSMQQEARENRINFNVNLGLLAMNLAYGKGNYDEEQIESIYRGKIIDNPYGVSVNQLYEQNRFNNLVPFDNSNYYQAFHSQISAQHNSIIKPDSNLKEMFDHTGELWATYELEEEQHRRRNLLHTYDSNGYKYFIRKAIAERMNSDQNRFNGVASPMINNTIPAPGTCNTLNIFTKNPRLQQDSHVVSTPSIDSKGNLDVTLSIPCNFGSQQGSNYIVNQNEATYDKKREEFNRFIDSIPRSIYTLTPGGG